MQLLSFLFSIHLTFSLPRNLQSDTERPRHFLPIYCLVTVLPCPSLLFLYQCVCVCVCEVQMLVE